MSSRALGRDLPDGAVGPASWQWLNTARQVGNSIGVALIGVIFFGALHHGYPRAFELSIASLIALLVAVAAPSRLLPAPPRIAAQHVLSTRP